MDREFRLDPAHITTEAPAGAETLLRFATPQRRSSRRHSEEEIDRRYLRLGASLYVPGSRDDLEVIGNGWKFPRLRSVVFCTEDSVLSADIPYVLRNIDRALLQMNPSTDLMRFIRVRSPEVLSQCLQMPGIENVDGFVLPKVTTHNIKQYMSQFRREDPFSVMITLETQETFDPREMRDLRDLMLEPNIHRRVLSIRIGGNDLLNFLGIRRNRGLTVYDTPLSYTISMLVSVFKPYGFNLTAPVCDYMNAEDTLIQECKLDQAHGLFGKTAIHPKQVDIIQAQYRVSREDLEMANAILDPSMPAVFRMYDSMCEPATHVNWASEVIARAEIYGHHD